MSVGKYVPIKLKFNRGVLSRRDPALIPINSLAEAVNLVLDREGSPTKLEGRQAYNAELGTNTPVKGQFAWIAEDGVEYQLTLANNRIYWSNGAGVETIVKYKNETLTPEIAIDTASYWYNMTGFDVSGAKVVYLHSDDYPASNTTNGTENAHCDISRAIMLYASGGVIYGKNVYYDNTGALTPGADDVEVGSGALQTGFPKGGKYSGTIFNRLVIVNHYDAKNGWIASEQEDSQDWTNAEGSANYGAGLQPEEFSGAFFGDTFFLCFTRIGILRVDCTPGEIGSWRETWLQSKYGNVGRNIVLHTDGLIYFISEKGICRTDGRFAEKVDMAIENQIKDLAQLKKSLYSWTLTTTTDWDAGTPSSGDNLFLTTGNTLIQKAMTVPAVPDLTNLDFENGIAKWTKSGTGDGSFNAVTGAGAYHGTGYVNCSQGNGNSLDVYAQILDASDNLILNIHLSYNGAYTKYTFVTASLTAYIGTNIKIRFRSDTTFPTTTNYLTRDAFIYKGQDISFYYYLRTVTDTARCDIDYFEITGYTDAITAVIDFGQTPTSYGNLVCQLSNFASGTHKIQCSASANNSDWDSWVDVKTLASGNNTQAYASLGAPPTVRRYLKFQIVYGSADPVLGYPLISDLYTGAQWTSATKDLGLIPSSWGVFNPDFQDLSQTVTFEINTSVDGNTWDGWIACNPGTVPTNTLRRYLRIRITLNSADYTMIPYVNETTLKYYTSGGASASLPCLVSFEERIYVCFSADGVVYNNHAWIGMTAPGKGLEYEPSPYLSASYPEWVKCDFMNYNQFNIFQGLLMGGSSQKGIVYTEKVGDDNCGTAFTSYLVSPAISTEDVESIWRMFYIFSKAGKAFNFYYRSRKDTDDWGAWSSAISLVATPFVSKSDKASIQGSLVCDFVQFKVESTVDDILFTLVSIYAYYATKIAGR